MNFRLILLDTILSAAYPAMVTQAAHLESNKAFTLFRYLLYRLYDQGRGSLVNSSLTIAQTTLAKKLNISRQWIGELTQRLETAGWIEHSSSKLPDGTNASSCWRIGRKLKWLLVRLTKSKQRKSPIPKPAKCTWHFSPLKREKEVLRLLAKETEPPSEAILEKIPLLRRWLARGKGTA